MCGADRIDAVVGSSRKNHVGFVHQRLGDAEPLFMPLE